jgi:hypothetical protein
MSLSRSAVLFLLAFSVSSAGPVGAKDGPEITLDWFKNALIGEWLVNTPQDMIDMDIEENRLERESHAGTSQLDLNQNQIDQYNAKRLKEIGKLLDELAKAKKDAAKHCPDSNKVKRLADAIGELDATRNRLESKAKIIRIELIHMAHTDDSAPNPAKAARLKAWKARLDKAKAGIDEVLKDAGPKLDDVSKRHRSAKVGVCVPGPVQTGIGNGTQPTPVSRLDDRSGPTPSLANLVAMQETYAAEPDRRVFVPDRDRDDALSSRDRARGLLTGLQYANPDDYGEDDDHSDDGEDSEGYWQPDEPAGAMGESAGDGAVDRRESRSRGPVTLSIPGSAN